MTPASQVVFDPMYAPADAKAAKVGTRRESGRQIKKVSLFVLPDNIDYIMSIFISLAELITKII